MRRRRAIAAVWLLLLAGSVTAALLLPAVGLLSLLVLSVMGAAAQVHP